MLAQERDTKRKKLDCNNTKSQLVDTKPNCKTSASKTIHNVHIHNPTFSCAQTQQTTHVSSTQPKSAAANPLSALASALAPSTTAPSSLVSTLAQANSAKPDSKPLPTAGEAIAVMRAASSASQPPNHVRRKRPPNIDRNPELQEFKRSRLGIDPSKTPSQNLGTFDCCIASKQTNRQIVHQNVQPPKWPTATQLRTTGFGRPSKNHSFRQEACFENTLIIQLKANYFPPDTLASLLAVNPLIKHLYHMIQRLQLYDFGRLREYNRD